MSWDFFFHVGVVSITLLVSALARARIPFLQRFLIPAPIIAGLLLLGFYNFLAPELGLRSDFLGEIVYHLLNISFISMLLRISGEEPKKVDRKRILAENVTAVMAQYGLQCFFGLIATFVMIKTFAPTLFPAFGYTLPLGFELGPGQAYSIALTWEKMGFYGASSVGLTMAAIGFLIGSFGGVVLINQGLRRGWIGDEHAARINAKSVRTGFFSRQQEERPIGSYLSTDGESLDTLSYHIALVMATYLLSWALLTGLSALLGLLGPLGVELAESLWGINFIFSAFCALLVKLLLRAAKVDTTLDNGTLNRISGLSVDMTVASSLGAISLVTVRGYWLPILILTLVGIFITMVILPWYCSRLYSDHQFFRMLVIYGTATGTLPTGLALLRVVDAEFETPVATDYLYSVGVVFVLALPILLTMNLPAFSVTQNRPALFGVAIGIAGLYVLLSGIAFVILARRRVVERPRSFFYTEKE